MVSTPIDFVDRRPATIRAPLGIHGLTATVYGPSHAERGLLLLTVGSSVLCTERDMFASVTHQVSTSVREVRNQLLHRALFHSHRISVDAYKRGRTTGGAAIRRTNQPYITEPY